MTTKRLYTILLLLLSSSIFMGCNNDNYDAQFTDLPAQIQSYINTHFAGQTVKYVSINRSYDEQMYKIGVGNDTTVIFSADNELQLLSCHEGVAYECVMLPIAQYLTQNYPNGVMTLYKREYDKIIVNLQGGDTLLFDLSGNFNSSEVR